MPANLSPEYHKAEQRFREARSVEEKREALEEMLRTIPKHKGTEKMQADLKRRLAKLKDEKGKKGAHGGPTYHVDREGMPQVILVGPPNAGKSALLAALTHAHPEVTPYPYATREPAPAVTFIRKARVQLVDTPSISADCWEAWMSPLIRAADMVALVADLGSSTALEDLDTAIGRLEGAGIFLGDGAPPEARPGIPAPCRKRTVLLCNKADAPGAADTFQALRDLYSAHYPVIAVSAEEKRGLADAGEEIFTLLRVVRAFTKQPGKEPSLDEPILLPEGSTVMDLARTIHKDMAEKFQFARVWGSAKFDGQKVERDHAVRDGDVVEIHA